MEKESSEQEPRYRVRVARKEDAARLLQIYSHYVTDTAVTFECSTPTLTEFESRIENVLSRYPYLVVEDDDGVVQGYAYAGPFKGRAAYDWSCELSIYLDERARGRGMGRLLYDNLERMLAGMGIVNLYACVAYPFVEDEYLTTNSADFHTHLGYRRVGVFQRCGYKFGRWYDMTWMEKVIGEHAPEKKPVTWFPELVQVEAPVSYSMV
jgi:phosphinothricin acetyltransferase